MKLHCIITLLYILSPLLAFSEEQDALRFCSQFLKNGGVESKIMRDNAGNISKVSVGYPAPPRREPLSFEELIFPEINTNEKSNIALEHWQESILLPYSKDESNARLYISSLNNEIFLDFLNIGLNEATTDFSNASLSVADLTLLYSTVENFDKGEFPNAENLTINNSTIHPFVITRKNFPKLKTVYLEGVNLDNANPAPLYHMPIDNLVLYDYKGENLNFLKGASLENLFLYRTYQVNDIKVLEELPLKKLSLVFLSLTDYSILQKMNLEELTLTIPMDLNFSLEWLKHMPLKKLSIHGSGNDLGSLNELKDLPLEELVLSHVVIEDFDTISELPLKNLAIDNVYLKSPNDLSSIKKLKELKNLFLGHVYYKDQLLNAQFDWDNLSAIPIETLSIVFRGNSSSINMDASMTNLKNLRLDFSRTINPDWKIFKHQKLENLVIISPMEKENPSIKEKYSVINHFILKDHGTALSSMFLNF